MSSRQEDGSSLKDHIESAKNNPFAKLTPSAKVEDDLEDEPPMLPEAANYVWSYFTRLHVRRSQAGMGGFLALGYADIVAFESLERISLEYWELRLIEAIDMKFLQVYQEQQEQEHKKQQNKAKK